MLALNIVFQALCLTTRFNFFGETPFLDSENGFDWRRDPISFYQDRLGTNIGKTSFFAPFIYKIYKNAHIRRKAENKRGLITCVLFITAGYIAPAPGSARRPPPAPVHPAETFRALTVTAPAKSVCCELHNNRPKTAETSAIRVS